MFDSMIVCVLLPRFPLTVAAADREQLLREPSALAPEPGREQMVGEVSPAAEAQGVAPGMRLGEALARCPRLVLVPPDPVGVADAWEAVVARLEGVGAAGENGPGVVGAGDARAFLAEQPIGLLRHRAGLERLPEPLERLGVAT